MGDEAGGRRTVRGLDLCGSAALQEVPVEVEPFVTLILQASHSPLVATASGLSHGGDEARKSRELHSIDPSLLALIN